MPEARFDVDVESLSFVLEGTVGEEGGGAVAAAAGVTSIECNVTKGAIKSICQTEAEASAGMSQWSLDRPW